MHTVSLSSKHRSGLCVCVHGERRRNVRLRQNWCLLELREAAQPCLFLPGKCAALAVFVCIGFLASGRGQLGSLVPCDAAAGGRQRSGRVGISDPGEVFGGFSKGKAILVRVLLMSGSLRTWDYRASLGTRVRSAYIRTAQRALESIVAQAAAALCGMHRLCSSAAL